MDNAASIAPQPSCHLHVKNESLQCVQLVCKLECMQAQEVQHSVTPQGHPQVRTEKRAACLQGSILTLLTNCTMS